MFIVVCFRIFTIVNCWLKIFTPRNHWIQDWHMTRDVTLCTRLIDRFTEHAANVSKCSWYSINATDHHGNYFFLNLMPTREGIWNQGITIIWCWYSSFTKSLDRSAIIIFTAAHLCTPIIGITLVTILTGAHWPVQSCRAQGVLSTNWK